MAGVRWASLLGALMLVVGAMYVRLRAVPATQHGEDVLDLTDGEPLPAALVDDPAGPRVDEPVPDVAVAPAEVA